MTRIQLAALRAFALDPRTPPTKRLVAADTLGVAWGLWAIRDQVPPPGCKPTVRNRRDMIRILRLGLRSKSKGVVAGSRERLLFLRGVELPGSKLYRIDETGKKVGGKTEVAAEQPKKDYGRVFDDALQGIV